MVLKYMMIN